VTTVTDRDKETVTVLTDLGTVTSTYRCVGVKVMARPQTHPKKRPDRDDTPLKPLGLDEITELIGDQGQCPDCGDPISGPALIKRCHSNHKAITP
jgi:hypothetical protein